MENEKVRETKKPDLEKQVANLAFIVRKMKDWLEEKMGADIDGDGRIGSGPYNKVKKILPLLAMIGLAGLLNAAPANTNIEYWNSTIFLHEGGMVAPHFYGQMDATNVTLNGPVTVNGKTTLNGELEVNTNDIDINIGLAANEIDITATNVAGTEGVPLIKVLDARTGATASDTNEATLVISSAGTYALSINNGILSIDDEIDAAGDITLDPAGNDVICDGTVDATAYTADAGAGLDVKTGGALKLGVTTATSVDIGVISTMTTVKGTLNVDQAVTLDSTLEVTSDATVLGGDIIGAKTNSIDIGEIADGQFTLKRSNSGTVTLTTLDDDANAALTIEAGGNGALKLGATDSTTEISSSDWTISTDGTIAGCAMSADQLTAGTAASAIDGGSISNLAADKIASGTLDNARLDTDLQALALNNGAALTNVQSANLIGVVPLANGGAGNASGILKANGAGLVSAAVPNTDYPAVTSCWGAVSYTGDAPTTGQLLNTNVVQSLDVNGGNLAGYAVAHIWVSTTDMGAASTNNIEALTLSTGTAINTVTANADYWYATSAAGSFTVVVEATAPGTNFVMTSIGPRITSKSIVFVP